MNKSKSKIHWGLIIFFIIFILLLIYLITSRVLVLLAAKYTITNDLWKGPESSSIALPSSEIIFNPNTFDVNIAITSLYLIDAIYSNHYSDPVQLQKHFFTKRQILIGGVFKYQDIYWVVFRGTINLYDCLRDSHTSQVKPDWPLIGKSEENSTPMIHSGFYSLYSEIREQIFDWINTIPTNSKIIVSGHSLGAGLAILCASDEIFSLELNTVLYTFGCPRVGNTDFISILNDDAPICYRIANTDDFVINTPLPITIRPLHPHSPYIYEHYGIPLLFNLNRYSYYRNHSIYTYYDGLKTSKV